jgi:hypothetical protein
MFRLKRLFVVFVLVLSFLAGHHIALKAQCFQCYQNPGPAGTLNYAYPSGPCVCNTQYICWYYTCLCDEEEFYHAQCGENFYCIGC